MSLADLDVGGYDLLGVMEAETQGVKGADSTTSAPRFGRRAPPTALDQEALVTDASRRASTRCGDKVPVGTASQDRRDGGVARRVPKRTFGGSGADGAAYSVNGSTADVKLPSIRNSHSRDGTSTDQNGTLSSRRRVSESEATSSAPSRPSATSPTASGGKGHGLLNASAGAGAGRQYPSRPQSTVETGTAAADGANESTEMFNDRVSVHKGSFTGGRGGWVREQARRLEEQVAAAQALANSPHSLSSIRQRSTNSSRRQRMEGSMSVVSPEKHEGTTTRRESAAPANAAEVIAASNRAAAVTISTMGHVAPPSASTTPARRPPSQPSMKRNLAPIATPSPVASTSKAPSQANASASTSADLLGNKKDHGSNAHSHQRTGRGDLNNNNNNTNIVKTDAVPHHAHELAHSVVPDSILSAEYGHALGTMDWNHEYDFNDLAELFPPAQSLQTRFVIGGAPPKNVKGTGATRVTPTPDRPAAAPLRHRTGPMKPPTKSVIPSAPSSGSTHDDHSIAGITPTNVSNASRMDAALDKPGSTRLGATPPSSAAVSPSAGSKPTDGSLYTTAQRAKLEVWQSVPILSYRPADAERYAADCGKCFGAAGRKKGAKAVATVNLYSFPAPGKAPPEMAGEAVELNYEIHNILTLMRHRHRKPMWTYPAVVPLDLPAQTRQRRPRTPRSFYGPERPERGNDWFRDALKDAVRVSSPDLTEIEAREAEEKKRNPKALKGVGAEVANAHRERQEQEHIKEINKAAVPIEA